MMKLVVLAVGVLAVSGPALADDEGDPFAAIGVYDRAAYDRTPTPCDEFAAHPDDPEKVTAGVARADMDLDAAIAACTQAVAADPANPRLNYQLARAYGYSGRYSEGAQARLTALNAGYPQSLFVIGYVRLIGWDGDAPDPCYGGELIRRSAQAGRFAGLVAFPHYALTGVFEGCDAHPAMDAEEMRSFLAAAGEATSDYYHGLLIEQLTDRLEAAAGP